MEIWFPSRIAQFPEGASQPATDTKSGNQPVKEVEQTCMHRLIRHYEIAEVDVLGSVRHTLDDG